MFRKKLPDVLPKTLAGQGSVHAEMKRCGRKNCRCVQGKLHGPYFYLYFREDGRLRKLYLKSSDIKEVQVLCQARRTLQNEQRQERQRVRAMECSGYAHYRRLVALFKDSELPIAGR